MSMLKASYQYYPLTFKNPSGTSRGVLHTKDSWILTIWDETNPQIVGYGECSIIKGLSHDNLDSLQIKIKEVCENISDYFYWLNYGLKSYPALQFAVETALLDLQKGGKHILFPSPFTEGRLSIPINGLLWMGSYDFMKQQLQEKTTQGFQCLKMKVGAIDETKEFKLLNEICINYPERILRIDANGAFSPNNILEKLHYFAKIGIHSIEQPIKAGQRQAMAKLCKETPIPIALDEELIGVCGRDNKANLLDQIRPQYIILKPSLLGGIKESEEWISLAEERGIGWWVTSALESNIGLNAIAQWTATLKNTLYQGLGTGSLYTNNIESPLKIQRGQLWHDPQKKWECF